MEYNYRSSEFEREGRDISRRDFLDALRGVTTGLVYALVGGPFVSTALEIGDVNKEFVRQAKIGVGLNQRLDDLNSNVRIRQLNEELDKIRAESKQRDVYLTNPPKYSNNEPDSVSVARLVYSEARSERKNPEILRHTASSVVNRAKTRGITIKDAIFQANQYKALRDFNSPYFYDPGKFVSLSEEDLKSWQECFEIGEEIILNGAPYPTTHTFLQKLNDPKQDIPDWVNTLTPVANIKTVDGKGIYRFLTEAREYS